MHLDLLRMLKSRLEKCTKVLVVRSFQSYTRLEIPMDKDLRLMKQLLTLVAVAALAACGPDDLAQDYQELH